LVDALAANGLSVEGALAAARPKGSVAAFLELHVEQGPLLEARGLPLGIVEGISGVINWTVRLSGRANHSGTTPMALRADAFAGLAAFAAGIPALIERAGGPESRITVGRVELQPGYPHTIPGQAEFSLIVRDLEEAVLDRLAAACRDELAAAAAGQGLGLSILDQGRLAPTACDPCLIALLQDEAEALGRPALTMPSGAGHDAQTLLSLCPAGLIFVPSRGGVSHAPEEWTDWADVAAGTELLGRALRRLAS
ncbi:MAG: hydantoinase/carbamoylase family amidase, partial [Tistlia sp.]